MTLTEIRQAAGAGPDWEVVWAGPDPLDPMLHLCTGLSEREGTFRAEWVNLLYVPTGAPGIEVARCEKCRIAYVRQRAASL
jgi:hypothetical protein